MNQDKVLSRTKLDGTEPEQGGIGVKLTYEHLLKQLIQAGAAHEHTEIHQVDVHSDGIVLLYKNDSSNIDLIGGEIDE